MALSKARRSIEIYEDYWKFTAAFTDIHGCKFRNALNVLVNYIDKNHKQLLGNIDRSNFHTSNLYKKIQGILVSMCNFVGKDASLSARKVINTFVKIGFIRPFLEGYHPLVKKFLKSSNKEQRRILFSKIFYESSSLASAITEDNSSLKHINFFLRTLDYNQKLTNADLTALMVTDINSFREGYLTRENLDAQYRFAQANNFIDRKYNQIGHLTSYLEHFIDIKYDRENEIFWFADDPEIAGIEFDKTYPRDNIKHRIYKEELKSVSRKIYGKVVCFLDKQAYDTLVASHIKPYKECMKEGKEDEAYDPENGLLLSPNIDSYFDKFKISFSSRGKILFCKNFDKNLKRIYSQYHLDSSVLTTKRKNYLKYHRDIFKQKEQNVS